MVQLKPDLCVIGAGSGGLSVAAAAAQLGVEVVLIERYKMGGDCLNYGCVPSKSLLAAAKSAQAMREAHVFGIRPVEPEIDYRAVQRHVKDVIAAIAPNNSVERYTGMGVRVIQADARFTGRNTVVAGDNDIQARRFILATGSSPAIPPIPGLDRVPYLTNETIFDAPSLPRHLLIIGGGPIGLEMAQAYRRLGSEVTVIEAATPLAKDDPEMRRPVLDPAGHRGRAAARPGASGAGRGARRRGPRGVHQGRAQLFAGRQPSAGRDRPPSQSRRPQPGRRRHPL